MRKEETVGRNILFVTKDLGSYTVMRSILEAFREAGHDPCIIAEGDSVEAWKSGGFHLDTDGGASSYFNVERVLDRIAPDFVVLGCGWPMNLEARFAAAAHARGIRQVWVEDSWGVSCRIPGPAPDILVTVDLCGFILLRREGRFNGSHVLIAADSELDEFDIPSELDRRVDELRKQHGTVILFCGEGWGTCQMLALMAQSLQHVREPYVFIPRWDQSRWGQGGSSGVWMDMVELIQGFGGKILFLDDVDSTPALAACCDIVVSGSCPCLMFAAKFGGVPVALTTDETRQVLREEGLNYTRWPGIEAELGIELTQPTEDLFGLVRAQKAHVLDMQKRYFSQPTLSPQEIVERILKILR